MRLRYSLVATTLGAGLDDDDTSVTFAEKLTGVEGDVATISSPDYLPLLIGDPASPGGCEVVHLTAYTAEATTGTISRGEDGSTAQAHDSGDRVVNAVLPADAVVVASSAPASPAAGQLWADTSVGFAPFDVTDYGATGDGTTDDTDAIALAVSAASQVTGVIYFPPGIYLTDPVSLNEVRGVIGSGPSSIVRLRPQSVSTLGDHALFQIWGVEGAEIEGFFIRDITLDGNKGEMSGTPTLNMEVVNFKHARGAFLSNVHAMNAVSEGFDLDYGVDCTIVGCRASDCNGNGFHMSNGAIGNALIGCIAEGCGTGWNRNGFDQYADDSPEANLNRYIGCTARDCYRNFNINGTAATFIGCQSIDGANADVFGATMSTGAADDL